MDVLVLAGGRGSRLAPWHAPKCLLPVNGVPMLYRLIDHLDKHLARRVIVCTGYRACDVVDALAHLSRRGRFADVETSRCDDAAQMGERLLHARKEWGVEGRVLVCYGDELADVDVRALERQHETARADATFTSVDQKLTFGVVEMRPSGAGHRSPLRVGGDHEVSVNIGFALIEPKCWDLLEPEDGLADWLNRIGERGILDCYDHEGRRATVNSLADLERAEAVWR